MEPLTLFGLVAVTMMLVFYALEDRSAWFVLAFAGACALGSAYGFLQGAWPFGVVEAEAGYGQGAERGLSAKQTGQMMQIRWHPVGFSRYTSSLKVA